MSSVFKNVIFDGISPFSLLLYQGVRRLLDPYFSTWNTPYHISKVVSDLGKPVKPLFFSAASSISNGLKYDEFGALAVSGDIKSQYPFQIPGRRLLLYHTGVFPCDAVLHSNYLSMNNWVPDPTNPPHTEASPDSSKHNWNKIPLVRSILSIISCLVSSWDNGYSDATSSVFRFSPSWNKY